MSDPILPFLTLDAAALLVLGLLAVKLPHSVTGFLTTMLTGMGALLCLPPLLMRMPPTSLILPVGLPGMPFRLALDPLSTVFLLLAFAAATAIAAMPPSTTTGTQTTGTQTARPSTAHPSTARPSITGPTNAPGTHATAAAAAGTTIAVLAADAVTLAIGLAIIIAATNRHRLAWSPIAVLAAIILLTPAGHAPDFDLIRIIPASPVRAAAAALLTIATALAWLLPSRPTATTTALAAPFTAYLLLRLLTDLQPAQPAWGTVLLLTGGAIAVFQSWRAAGDPDLAAATAALSGRHAGLATASIGLAIIARATDLPAAAILALNAAWLSVIATSLAGTLATLAAQAIGASAGTTRLSRLGGLIHLMPATALAMGAGLLTLSALPPTLGFAALWLVFQAILAAPRTGFLLSQLPLAAAAAMAALSTALATAAFIRLTGIALLGRPRSPRGAGASESPAPAPAILLILAAAILLAGLLPNPLLWLLTEPATNGLLGGASALHPLALSGAAQPYRALPVLALVVLIAGAAIALRRRPPTEATPAGPWLDGMTPEVGLPFGDPTAQSAGAGFRPPLPPLPLPRPPPLPAIRPPTLTTGLWLVLAAFAVLLLVLAVTA